MTHRRITSPGAPPTQAHGYSHVVAAGDLLFISGQVAMDTKGDLVSPGDMGGQTRQALGNLTALLKACGAAWSDVAKLNIYLTDMREIDAVRKVRADVFSREGIEPPAITTVEVTHLAIAGALIEIEAIAIRQRGS